MMKKIYIISTVFIFFFISCQKDTVNSESPLNIQKNEIVTRNLGSFDGVFTAIEDANIDFDKDEALYIDFFWDTEEGGIVVTSAIKKKLDYIPIFAEYPVDDPVDYGLFYDSDKEIVWMNLINEKTEFLEIVLIQKLQMNVLSHGSTSMIYLPQIKTFHILPGTETTQ